MTTLAWDAAAPAAWEVIPGVAPGEARLRLGARIYRLDDVVASTPTSVTEYNIDGHLMTVAMFLAAGAAFLLPVAMAIASPKFLVGTVLFFGIGIMVLLDITQGHRHVMHRLDLRFADGSATTFACVDASIRDGLAAALSHHGLR